MRHLTQVPFASLLAFSLSFAAACSNDDTLNGDDETAGDTGNGLDVPDSYEFESRFEDASSVSYSGQVFRQVLISSLKTEMSTIQDEIDNDGKVFAEGEVRARLEFYYVFDSDTAGDLTHGVSTDPAPLQTSFNDISSGKDLKGKIAGQDEIGQHKDWSAGIVGWEGNLSPDALVLQWFDEVDALAVAYSSGNIPTSPGGTAITKWYVDAEGRDYQQLLQKFLLGAINYSQGTDDYLDDDTEGKGLLTDNVDRDEGAAYTALEHSWDEGFGYWGAARDYLAYEDAQLAETPYVDHDEDGVIDLTREYSFGASINASKRDNGAAEGAETDFSRETMVAFLTGRAIIAAADGPLSDEDLAALQAQRDIAVTGWEKSLAATAVHYINDSVQDIDTDAAWEDLAGHWSELKGFVLALQFNPRKAISDTDFATLNELIGTAPGSDLQAYKADLIAARDILGTTYEFDAANLGDANGEGGW